jgi:hypothetical protein
MVSFSSIGLRGGDSSRWIPLWGKISFGATERSSRLISLWGKDSLGPLGRSSKVGELLRAMIALVFEGRVGSLLEAPDGLSASFSGAVKRATGIGT